MSHLIPGFLYFFVKYWYKSRVEKLIETVFEGQNPAQVHKQKEAVQKTLAGQTDPISALETLDRFRVLCAHNKGDSITLQINHLCENILRSHLKFDITRQFFKKIIMIRSNDYHKGLFNGDTGSVHEENKT